MRICARHVAAAAALAGCLAQLLGCSEPHSEGGALVVRQVLNANQQLAGAGGDVAVSAPSPVPGMSLGSTLVADSPRALYRRAYDQSRRRADGASPRERIAALDADVDSAAAPSDSQMLSEE